MNIDVNYRIVPHNENLNLVITQWSKKRDQVIQLLGPFFDSQIVISFGVIPLTSVHTDILFFTDVPRDLVDMAIGKLLARGINITMVLMEKNPISDENESELQPDNLTGHETT